MTRLRDIPISSRLWLILLTWATMLLAVAGLILQQNLGDLNAVKALKTRHVVETAGSILRYYQGQESARKLSCETRSMIERLQVNSAAAVQVIDESGLASVLTVEQALMAGQSLEHFTQSLRNLTGLNKPIASAPPEAVPDSRGHQSEGDPGSLAVGRKCPCRQQAQLG